MPRSEPPQPQMPGSGKKAGLIGIIALAISATFALEGGYVNDQDDPGGETNHGVTVGTARQSGFDGAMIDLKRECDYSIRLPQEIASTLDPEVLSDILSDNDGSQVCAAQIYYEGYIRKPGFVPLFVIDPWVAREVFDTAINMGPRRPSKFFQRAVNEVCNTTLTPDGAIGPLTVKAWSDCREYLGPPACVSMIHSLDRQQANEYNRLIRRNPTLNKYRKGWFNHRIGNVSTIYCGS